MAVDTRDKRMSMIGLGSPVPRVLPNPDGSFVAADRAMLLYLYHGFELLNISEIDVTGLGTIYVSAAAGITYVSSPTGTIN